MDPLPPEGGGGELAPDSGGADAHRAAAATADILLSGVDYLTSVIPELLLGTLGQVASVARQCSTLV